MATDRIIGIDVGTTSIKAALLNRDGSIHEQFARNYVTKRHDNNKVEQDPDDWVRLINSALNGFNSVPVAAVGLCSQVNTHVFVGSDGNALCPAISWQDGRAAGEAATLDARISAAQKEAWWGAPMPIDASHAIARMAWMAKHRPDVWEKTRWVMLPKDYCLLKLTGEASTDPLSNIGLVDRQLNYIDEVLALVPGAGERMAPLVHVTDVAGQLIDTAFKGVPVVSGTMDAWAGLVGTGGAKESSTIYLSGTSEILGISSTKVVPTPGVIVFPECNGLRVHAAPTQNGGDAKLWFTQVSGLSMTAMAQMVEQTPRSAATPLFLPQLDGERAPLWNSDLRAAFLGVSRQTRMPDFARAVYEGVAFAARYALDVLQVSADVNSELISCAGGGFRSPSWNQIRADVLGKPLQTLATGEPGILGAASLAAIGVGHYSDIEQAWQALAGYDALYTPVQKQRATYDTVFDLYKDAITANAELGKRYTEAAMMSELR